MEHKPCKAVIRRTSRQEPVHFCGTCGNYTEDYEIDGERYEHCLAGYSYEHTRHCINCDKWERGIYV